MSNCELCQQGNPAVTVGCYNCRSTFHLHLNQLDLAGSGNIILVDCPKCEAVNSFLKRGRRRLAVSAPVIFGGQTFLDLRSSPGQGRYQVSK